MPWKRFIIAKSVEAFDFYLEIKVICEKVVHTILVKVWGDADEKAEA